MEKLLIKGGRVVTATKEKYVDILIEDGKVVRLAGDIPPLKEAEGETLDARGKVVLPGLVESHMHIKAPLGGITDILDFESASKCAAFGGVTTFMDFSSILPGESLAKAVEDRLTEMAVSAQDYAIHCKIVNLVSREKTVTLMQAELADAKEHTPETALLLKRAREAVEEAVESRLDEIPAIIRQRHVPTFKMFMTYKSANVMIDDTYMLKVMEKVRDAGGRCGFHAESNAISEYNDERFAKAEAKSRSWEDFPASKPDTCEEEAVRRVLYYAEMLKVPVFFFHITTAGAVRAVKEAQERGVDVLAETCTHYLTLTDEKNKGEDGILYIMSPPLRSEADRKALWKGLADGTLTQVTSDNCSFPRWMKEQSLKKDANGKVLEKDYSKVISGVSGLEERLPLMLAHVCDRPGRDCPEEISLKKFVALCCSNPARNFGCYPQKGTIRVGGDADIIVVDLTPKRSLALGDLHYPVYIPEVNKNGLEYAVYEGCPARGRVIHTIRRGEFLVKNGEYVAETAATRGQFIERKLEDLQTLENYDLEGAEVALGVS